MCVLGAWGRAALGAWVTWKPPSSHGRLPSAGCCSWGTRPKQLARCCAMLAKPHASLARLCVCRHRPQAAAADCQGAARLLAAAGRGSGPAFQAGGGQPGGAADAAACPRKVCVRCLWAVLAGAPGLQRLQDSAILQVRWWGRWGWGRTAGGVCASLHLCPHSWPASS